MRRFYIWLALNSCLPKSSLCFSLMRSEFPRRIKRLFGSSRARHSFKSLDHWLAPLSFRTCFSSALKGGAICCLTFFGFRIRSKAVTSIVTFVAIVAVVAVVTLVAFVSLISLISLVTLTYIIA